MKKLLPFIILAVVGFFLLNRKAATNNSTFVPVVNRSSSSQSSESINATLLLQQQVNANNAAIAYAAKKASSINNTYVAPIVTNFINAITPPKYVSTDPFAGIVDAFKGKDMTNPYIQQSYQKAIAGIKAQINTV
jgi:hypothetical protein